MDELNNAMAESRRRAQRGREIAEEMFFLTSALVALLLVYAFVLAPQCGGMMCPMFESRTEAFGVPADVIIGMVGFVGLATGLFWMWRIVRADPDPDSMEGRRRAWVPRAMAAVVGAIIGLLGLLVAAVHVIALFFIVVQPGFSRRTEPTSTALIAGAGFVGAMIGFAWMVRISRGFQRRSITLDFDELNVATAESNKRARGGRTIARLMFASAVALAMFGFFVVAAAPSTMGGGAPRPIDMVLTMLGLVGLAAGVFWMWRIVRES